MFLCRPTISFSVLAILFCGCSSNGPQQKPPIIEVFACSDYCPGPEEKYTKQVYEGVSDKETCLKLGGTPYMYIGWGNYFVCIAK